MLDWLVNVAFAVFSAGLLLCVVQVLFKRGRGPAQAAPEAAAPRAAAQVAEEGAEAEEAEHEERRRGGRRAVSLAEVEERIVKYLVKGGYSLNINPSGGKLYIRAIKGREQKNIGPLTEETRKILEKYGLTVKQQN